MDGDRRDKTLGKGRIPLVFLGERSTARVSQGVRRWSFRGDVRFMLCLLCIFLTYCIISTKYFSHDIFVGICFFRRRGSCNLFLLLTSFFNGWLAVAGCLCFASSTDAILRRISSRMLFLLGCCFWLVMWLRRKGEGSLVALPHLKRTSKMVDLLLRIALVGLSNAWREEVLPADKESNRLDDRWRERIHYIFLGGYRPWYNWQLFKSDTYMSNQ